jgi:hypothetical protein
MQRLPGVRPNATDYQLVMWKAYCLDNWTIASNIWARIRTVGLEPDALGYALLLRMAAEAAEWEDGAKYRYIYPLGRHAQRRRSARWRQAFAKVGFAFIHEHQDTNMRASSSVKAENLYVTKHLLRKLPDNIIEQAPEIWSSLVHEMAAHGDLIGLRDTLAYMRRQRISLTSNAIADVLRRLMITDLLLTDKLLSRLPHVPLRVHGWIMEAYLVLGDRRRFLAALRRALQLGWRPTSKRFTLILKTFSASERPKTVSITANLSK